MGSCDSWVGLNPHHSRQRNISTHNSDSLYHYRTSLWIEFRIRVFVHVCTSLRMLMYTCCSLCSIICPDKQCILCCLHFVSILSHNVKDDIGLGAVVGSADFNIMLVVSVTALFAKQVSFFLP